MEYTASSLSWINILQNIPKTKAPQFAFTWFLNCGGRRGRALIIFQVFYSSMADIVPILLSTGQVQGTYTCIANGSLSETCLCTGLRSSGEWHTYPQKKCSCGLQLGESCFLCLRPTLTTENDGTIRKLGEMYSSIQGHSSRGRGAAVAACVCSHSQCQAFLQSHLWSETEVKGSSVITSHVPNWEYH